jgi:hypothetical protein
MWPFCLPFFLLIMASLAFKEYEYLKPHISIKRFRDEVMFLRICLKHYPWPELSELLHFFTLCSFQLQEYVLQLNHSSLCKAHS